MKKKVDFMSCYKKRYDTSNGFGSASEWRGSFYKRMTGEEAAKIMKDQKQTPYEILGVKIGATIDEIKAAFRKLIMQFHPDKNPGNEDYAKEMSQKIIAAYTILSN